MPAVREAGTSSNAAEAVTRFRKGVELRHSWDEGKMDVFYAVGYCVEADLGVVREWCEKAVEHDNKNAAKRLDAGQ